MAKEIERKFIVTSSEYKFVCDRKYDITQGYLSDTPEATVRVRIQNDRAFLTVKGINNGIERNEWEYPIPLSDAKEMILICKSVISKTRYLFGRWEIDEFHAKLEGLTVAEIELNSPTEQIGPLPSFIGKEVTGDPRYYNSVLSATNTLP